jgi:uncharacterized protein
VKVVLDTNVLMSGVFFAGLPGEVLAAWREGRVTLAASPEILDEYRRVGVLLEERYGSLGLHALLAVVATTADIVEPLEPASPISRDSDDDKFLLCAVAAAADAVVTGDEDLLTLRAWRSVEILSPRQFVDRYLRGRPG